jgi:hypothetical protein
MSLLQLNVLLQLQQSENIFQHTCLFSFMCILHTRCAIHLKNYISDGAKCIGVHKVHCALLYYTKFVTYRSTIKFPNVSTFVKFDKKKYNFIESVCLFIKFYFPISEIITIQWRNLYIKIKKLKKICNCFENALPYKFHRPT